MSVIIVKDLLTKKIHLTKKTKKFFRPSVPDAVYGIEKQKQSIVRILVKFVEELRKFQNRIKSFYGKKDY